MDLMWHPLRPQTTLLVPWNSLGHTEKLIAGRPPGIWNLPLGAFHTSPEMTLSHGHVVISSKPAIKLQIKMFDKKYYLNLFFKHRIDCRLSLQEKKRSRNCGGFTFAMSKHRNITLFPQNFYIHLILSSKMKKSTKHPTFSERWISTIFYREKKRG